jgi:hypothetical protein
MDIWKNGLLAERDGFFADNDPQGIIKFGKLAGFSIFVV